MHRLSFVILFVLKASLSFGQSPHGINFKLDCIQCHTAANWQVNPDSISFRHDSTLFKLTGQHTQVDCKSCHSSLVFSDAEPNCVSCHQDMHSRTLGNDCVRCHSTNNWEVSNISRLHQLASFPLLGVHATVNCNECHKSSDPLRYDRIGSACVNCHITDYQNKEKIDHVKAGFSTNCTTCHNENALDWKSSYNHDFFPLTMGHDLDACSKCHTSGNYSSTSPACESCHKTDYLTAKNPDHTVAQFSLDCKTCHSVALDWKPAQFTQHDDKYFPIYTGKHAGTWNECTACHSNTTNYQVFACIECHEHNKPVTDQVHATVNGYSFSSTACLACHPTGNADVTFDHSRTKFPLTGGHIGVDCISCHAKGYAGTSTKCVDCHLAVYNSAINPNHKKLNLSTECASCHSTIPDWELANFPDHNAIYKLEGAHTAIKNDCASCHHGTYDGSTPTTCVGCHLSDYNTTTNPNHKTSNFPTTCVSCHSQAAW
ncbi:MAG: hypothetical protein ABI761_15785, partial [Saprospiraceae bacterium]